MSAARFHKLHEELCQILGLDPNMVQKIRVTAEVQHLVLLEATMLPTAEQVERLVETVKQYTVTPFSEKEQEIKDDRG